MVQIFVAHDHRHSNYKKKKKTKFPHDEYLKHYLAINLNGNAKTKAVRKYFLKEKQDVNEEFHLQKKNAFAIQNCTAESF